MNKSHETSIGYGRQDKSIDILERFKRENSDDSSGGSGLHASRGESSRESLLSTLSREREK